MSGVEDFNEFMDAYFARKEEELQKFADVHGIKNLDLNIIRCLGNVRRPLVLVRGKSITVEEVKKVITGVPRLYGCEVEARELRGGAGLVIAGCMAEGETVVKNRHFIERGYEDICRDYRNLGVNIVTG